MATVKKNPWDPIGDRTHRPRTKRLRRKSVTTILKEAYQRHVRDGLTLRAVKAVLH